MKKFITVLLLMFFCTVTGYAQAEETNYKGIKKCKMCHIKIYKTWQQTKHASAFDRLNEKEKLDPSCFGCHTTNNDPMMPGILCEACHGPGSGYSSPKIMNKKKYKANPELQRKMAIEAGLVIAPGEDNCKKCHNEKSPHYQGFDFKARYEEIKHKK